MIKSALQYIIGLQKPRIEQIRNKIYYFHDDHIPMLVDECRDCETVQLSTLTSLVDYIKNDMKNDFPADLKMIVHVASEKEVRLITKLNSDMKRWGIVTVNARVPDITLNRFVEQEFFIIQMQSMFLETPDKAIVMQVAGNVEEKTVANYGDDGVSQKATIRTGLANVEDVIVPNPVKLKPFRTFHEVGQQETEFVFRMKNGRDGVMLALYEADGGSWKFRAVHEIADYLKNKLKGIENVTVLS